MAQQPSKSSARAEDKSAANPARQRSKRTRQSDRATRDENGRFKSGQSGNLKGRPPKDRCILKHIQEELDAELQVTENGQIMRLSKREALAKLLVNKGLQGDHRALTLLFKILPIAKDNDNEDHAQVPLDAVLNLLLRRGQIPEKHDPSDGGDRAGSDDQDERDDKEDADGEEETNGDDQAEGGDQ